MGVFRISDENRSAYFRRWNDGRYLEYFISDPSVTINIRVETEILQVKEIYSHVHLSISNHDASIREALLANLALALFGVLTASSYCGIHMSSILSRY